MKRFLSDNEKIQRFKIPVLKQLGLLAVLLILLFSSGITDIFSKDEPARTPTANSQKIPTQSTDQSSGSQNKTFSNIHITAKSAYVWDVNSQKALYKKNESEQLPLASLTKLMTALVAEEVLGEHDAITISETAIKQDGVSGLSSGETFDRMALSDLMLISSSNDGAYALAYAAGAVLAQKDPANAFVQAMNIRADELGLTQTFFKNPTGLDISLTEAGSYGTARDISFLMEYIIKNEPNIIEFTKDREIDITSENGETHETENTNYYVDQIPGLIASKTGYTDLAGGNLVVAFDAGLNRPIIITVLGSTRQERFSDVMALVNETKEYFK